MVKVLLRLHGPPPSRGVAGWVVRLGSPFLVIRCIPAVLTAFMNISSRQPCCPDRPATGHRPRPPPACLPHSPACPLGADPVPPGTTRCLCHSLRTNRPGEGYYPLPTPRSHRQSEGPPSQAWAPPLNHWFTDGPQAPRGTPSPLRDTVAHRATGSPGGPAPASSTPPLHMDNPPARRMPGSCPSLSLPSHFATLFLLRPQRTLLESGRQPSRSASCPRKPGMGSGPRPSPHPVTDRLDRLPRSHRPPPDSVASLPHGAHTHALSLESPVTRGPGPATSPVKDPPPCLLGLLHYE